MLTEDGIQWLYLVSVAQISTSIKVIYSRVSLAKESTGSTLSKLWQIPKNVIRTKNVWFIIFPVLLYTGIRFL